MLSLRLKKRSSKNVADTNFKETFQTQKSYGNETSTDRLTVAILRETSSHGATETAQKMKFSIKDFFSKCGRIQFPADLVTLTKEILNGKLHFLCSVINATVCYWALTNTKRYFEH